MNAHDALLVLHRDIDRFHCPLVFQHDKDGAYVIDEIKFDGKVFVLRSILTSAERSKLQERDS